MTRAYDDARGVTAVFNLNMLVRVNREFAGGFHVSRFAHRAIFNPSAARIEMHLVSRVRQTVTVAGVPVSFERGETIWTESSYKYDEDRLQQLVTSAGFAVRKLWTDEAEQFWVAFLSPA